MTPVPHPRAARVALVTGAGRGLGRHLTLALARSGVAVGLLGRTADTLDAVAAEVRAGGGRAATATADVTVWAQVHAAVAVLEEALGGADLLVNNAGVIEPVEVPVWEADPHQWWSVVEADLRGPFHCVRAVVPGMVARGGGRVVDLSSGAGARDRAAYSAYCAAKAGLFRIGGNLHLAGYRAGLRSFEVSPGVVRTDMTAAMPVHAQRQDWNDPDDLAGLVLAIAAGGLDAWSGRFLRAGLDTAQSLAAAAASGVDPEARRLRVRPYAPHDPAP
jgi:NAD(P)-dependent dehydrogenase (short-subunit alcohol dehydrogenase family)